MFSAGSFIEKYMPDSSFKKFWDAKLLSYISKKNTHLELVNKKKRFKGAKEPF